MNEIISKPRLISFKLCPFVQRAAIVLSEKKIDYQVEYIDLNNPPAWFLDVSPLKRVPVLEVNGSFIFESNVICEYLEDAFPRRIHPIDNITRAINRGWNEFANDLMFKAYAVCVAQDECDYLEKLNTVWDKFDNLELAVSNGPYFNGSDFSMVDAVYMPLFQRLGYLERYRNDVFDSDRHPKIMKWKKNLFLRASLKDSEVPDQENYFREFIAKKNVYFSKMMEISLN